MKKTTLIVLMGALITLFTLPSFTSTAEQKASSEKIEAAGTDYWTANLANTLNAYEMEVNTSAKYAAFSEQAKKEGDYEVALLFRAISKASDIHAKNHKAVLEEAGEPVPEVEPMYTVKSTKENLKRAIAYESHQAAHVYPKYIIDATRAQNQTARKSMSYAYLTSQKHKAFFEKALYAMESWDWEMLATTYFVCPTCGNIYEYEVDPYCQFSETPYSKYIKISD